MSHRQNLDRVTDRVRYEDPQLLGSNVGLAASLAGLSDGHERLLTLDRVDIFRYGIRGRSRPVSRASCGPSRLSSMGSRSSGYRSAATSSTWRPCRALLRGENHAVRVHGAYRAHEVRVGGDHRDYSGPEVGLRTVTHRFVRLTHVNQFERTEDFNLGTESHAVLRLSAPAFNGQEAVFVSAGHRHGVRLRDDHFVVIGVGFDGRRERGAWRNRVAAVNARYLQKHSPRTAFVGKLDYVHGHNLDPEVQLRLGAETGLRGYPVRQFTGTRSLLLTLEERAFFADDVWQLFSFGVAGFVDSGFVWPAGRPVDLGDLRTGVGISLLVGSHRLASRGGGTVRPRICPRSGRGSGWQVEALGRRRLFGHCLLKIAHRHRCGSPPRSPPAA